MIETAKKVLEGTLDRLRYELTTYLPALLAALVLALSAYVTAVLVRWLIYKMFKGLTIDRFLRQSGVAFLMDPRGRLRATRLVAETTYWCLLMSGVLLGLNAFNTDLTNRIAQSIVFLLPKVFIAGLILLGGGWLGQYLGRSMLVWAVNENFPSPHRLAAAVRVLTMFVAVVVSADQLNFAKSVFFAAFVIIVGGAALAAGLAIGLGKVVTQRFFEDRRNETGDSAERSLWSHL